MSNWQVILLEPAKTVLSQIGQFLISVLLMIIILIIGWFIARLIKNAVTKGLRLVRIVDYLSEKTSLDSILEKGGIKYSLSELIGVIAYWLALLITFGVAISFVGVPSAADLLNKIIYYIPNIVAAIFILILGMFAGTLLRNIVQTAATNAGLSEGRFLSKSAEIIIIVFAVIVALGQLNIGIRITEVTWAIILGSIGLGCALAFGLGCKDIAARSVSDLIEKLKKK